jgi:hypothetical protein
MEGFCSHDSISGTRFFFALWMTIVSSLLNGALHFSTEWSSLLKIHEFHYVQIVSS